MASRADATQSRYQPASWETIKIDYMQVWSLFHASFAKDPSFLVFFRRLCCVSSRKGHKSEHYITLRHRRKGECVFIHLCTCALPLRLVTGRSAGAASLSNGTTQQYQCDQRRRWHQKRWQNVCGYEKIWIRRLHNDATLWQTVRVWLHIGCDFPSSNQRHGGNRLIATIFIIFFDIFIFAVEK